MPSSAIDSALIGASAAILGISIRDVIVPLWVEHRGKRKEDQDVFKRYAVPLAQAAESTLWRLDEIITGRYRYLRQDCPKTEFYNYKSLSTCYRLALLLGWMRAIDKEIARLPHGGASVSQDITEATNRIRNVLADGYGVEQNIVDNIMEIWGVNVDLTWEEKSSLAADVVGKIDIFLYRNGLEKMFSIKSCSEAEKVKVIYSVRDVISNVTRETISDDVVHKTMERAAEALSIVDVWIYRDWQDAIGESILIDDSSSPRRYKPIGFGEYEAITRNDCHEGNIWYRRTASLFLGMDIHETKFDVRVNQIRQLFSAVGGLLVALSDHMPSGERYVISKDTLNKAEYAASCNP